MLAALHTTVDGLTAAAARQRLEHWGPNTLDTRPQASALRLLLNQFRSPLVLILVFKASTVKLTVIGRPTQVVDRGEVVIFGLLSDKSPLLPKGLPAPPQQTKYLVLVAKKQWTKVAEAIKAEDDVLIIEGYPAFEPRHPGSRCMPCP